MRLLAFVLLASHAFAGCVHKEEICTKLERAPLVKLHAGVPPFIYANKTTFYVEMRSGKLAGDCEGETIFRLPGQMSVLILADNLGEWDTRETLHHEISHIAAYLHPDGKCRFRDEDEAIEHLSPGLVDIFADSRNKQLVEYLTK